MRAFLIVFLCSGLAAASVFGGIRGLVHDPQHRPIAGATVTVRATHSAWTRSTTSDAEGQFLLNGIPAGEYVIEVQSPGFATQSQNATVLSDRVCEPHFPMAVETAQASVSVIDTAEDPQTATAAAMTLVKRDEISHTPGAQHANPFAMVP